MPETPENERKGWKVQCFKIDPNTNPNLQVSLLSGERQVCGSPGECGAGGVTDARGERAGSGILKAYLHGTTLSHATSLQQAYITNCFV